MFTSIESRVEALAAHMDARDQEVRQELAIYKTVVLARVMATHEAPRVEHYFEAIALTDDATKIKRHFYLEDVAYLARKNMKCLKHTSSIHEYVKEFSTLMLEIPNMFEEELLFNFMDNLQSWVEQELKRRGVQDLVMVMAVVESLVEYKMGDSFKPKPQSKGNHAKCGEDKGSRGYTPKEGSSKTFGGKDDCPKRKALNAMIEESEKEGDAHALVNGKATKALVATSVFHNFVLEDEAKRLELQASKEEGWLKAVNSASKPSHREAHWVAMHISSWKGIVDFTVVPMDNFKMVLGMDFLQKVKVVPLSFLCSMAILEEEKPCMVPMVTKDSPKTPMLSVMQPMPMEIKRVLDEFKDMISAELPKRLSLMREEDHKIELESEVKPPSMGPYRMATLELEELRRQLKEFLDARYFTKLDLRSGYYQVRIAEEDKPKTTCVTRYGLYEFLVMPFDFTNAPTMFCTLMNKIFHPYLDKFMVVYFDDIVIYSNTLKKHVEHLRKVFTILRQNELYVKKEKCSFAKKEVSFLGHCIQDGKLMMDDNKFIKGYSTRATSLTDLLKKNRAWEWDKKCQQAFEDLKKVVTKEPVLALPDHTKPQDIASLYNELALMGHDGFSKGGLQHDPMAKSLIALAHEGKTKRFWVKNDLLYTKER
ncbi:Retrovirus-related Pol polyprotein from transposon 297 [Vitis vinifera]|uniref:Retrovirus-related Pol polyprotein from transposon 297 n=1 Tax=Vitis vinifera TaxID=29760 RepID=A0A438JBJ9_VITVI|nr:Retrovirus-related Pol polyprotein from transposon 297 [Vitis vinifera]